MADKLMLIAGIVLGLVIGFGGGYLLKWGIDRVKMAELESQASEAQLARISMQEQWEEAINELSATRILLNDTLAAIELLKKYETIDNKTKKDINDLKSTLDDQGNPTQKTQDLFNSLVDNFNQLNGNLGLAINDFDVLDIQPFKDLRSDAEKLYERTREITLELGLELWKRLFYY